MKKSILSVFLLLMLFSGCAPKTGGLCLATFSYAETEEQHAASDVAPENFVNQAPSKITDQLDAEKLALKECTVSYTHISDYYDKESDMWCIAFFSFERDEQGVLHEVPGSVSQMVYLNGEGVTQKILYETID